MKPQRMKTDLLVSRSRRSTVNRRGAIVVLAAFLIIFLMAVLAMTIDIGYMQNARVEIDRAVDAGALAGAGLLADGQEEAVAAAREFTKLNRVAGRELSDSQIETEVGDWNKTNRAFSDPAGVPYALRVFAENDNVRPMFFGRVFGRDHFSVAAEAVAVYQPRDIVLVLDYSASMNDDSELRSISTIGQAEVEENLLTIWEELGSHTYGSLPWAPAYLTVTGTAPANSAQSQVKVEYRYNSVYVTSTKPFNRIRAYRSNGSFVSFTGTGTWNASISAYETVVNYSSNQITQVEVRAGYTTVGGSTLQTQNFYFNSTSTIRSHMKTCFGLTSVTYPYSGGGSWDRYIDYCRSNSYNSNAGYFYKFGLLNLVNYWLEQFPSYASNPNLWNTSEYPITAVKNAVTVFLSFLQEMESDDRLALAVYNSSDGTALLERGLDEDMTQIEDISRERQAGHYHSNTNIGAGVNAAWNELDDNARPGAFKMIVLMTDGIANMPTSGPMTYLNQQVALCAQKKYPIVTISLGAGADAATLQTVADTTGGVHFNIPGGQPVADYEDQLKEAFGAIAKKRPLQLVK